MIEPHWYRTLWWYAVLADEPAWPTPVTVQLGAAIVALGGVSVAVTPTRHWHSDVMERLGH